ncbi:GNAT family N-acetyltransferase [Enterovibrio nigricans]|uniref:Acetyltransferase (GNAT) domain-containing protein n=1 Tax=Enterovibrio nigricans DSM 22720 TaxID=1121868 RepID=A0A1T4V0M5_9GAMM|nr:GNAT family N-acetyltransferase [Enterovibrio nigricans]SKA58475.1 Acetyltransferase (GNAT) domain-containing protein [Enterovibrio nigricans DSM 22720]
MHTLSHRLASADDFDFLYELKKAAEGESVKRIWGWDELVQQKIHNEELEDAVPQIIEFNGERVGCFLFQEREDHCYFSRFFILPECQGKGFGSHILKENIAAARECGKPLRLCYLRGNRVDVLYRRFDFTFKREDEHFVYMVLEHG